MPVIMTVYYYLGLVIEGTSHEVSCFLPHYTLNTSHAGRPVNPLVVVSVLEAASIDPKLSSLSTCLFTLIEFGKHFNFRHARIVTAMRHM